MKSFLTAYVISFIMNYSKFLFCSCFGFFETGFLHVALAVLELAL